MLGRRRTRAYPPPVMPSRGGHRNRVRTWLLEWAVVALVGVNGYLLYSMLLSSSTPAASTSLAVATPGSGRPVSHAQVEILNGCGQPGVTQQARLYLRDQGFDVVNVENAENFQFPETVVLDRRGGGTVSREARAVAQAIGATHVALQRNDDRMVDVTVIIGRDYEQLRFVEE